MREHVAGNLREYSRKLDARGSSAHDHEIDRLLGRAGKDLALGEFEGEQNAAPDFERVFDGLQSGGVGLPSS